ncbi:MAG: hypothetical protein C0485_00200 [Pirellula sp.]|nr:hypothetical protein [Pirellula sp.]
MAISRNTKLAVGAILGVAALAVVGGLVFRGEYATTQGATRSFKIDDNFTGVRKVLVRTDAAKQIVTMGGGSTFVSQDWQTVGGDPGGTLRDLIEDPNWRLELHGTLKVLTKDEYIGEHEISLDQRVVITPDSLVSEVHLKEPTARLKKYDMTTKFARDPQTGNTVVDLSLTQEILTDAPWFAHGIADRRVLASVERTLANQETAIRKVIADNIADVPLFPLR